MTPPLQVTRPLPPPSQDDMLSVVIVVVGYRSMQWVNRDVHVCNVLKVEVTINPCYKHPPVVGQDDVVTYRRAQNGLCCKRRSQYGICCKPAWSHSMVDQTICSAQIHRLGRAVDIFLASAGRRPTHPSKVYGRHLKIMLGVCPWFSTGCPS